MEAGGAGGAARFTSRNPGVAEVAPGRFRDLEREAQAVGVGDWRPAPRVRTHNQNMTVAAMQMAERKSSPHLS